jgi:hypothetical protein
MNSDDEVIHVFVEEQTNANIDEEEHFMTLRSSSTRRQNLEGHAMLCTDYFSKKIRAYVEPQRRQLVGFI